MSITSSSCRAQESVQRELAATTPLKNVRETAERAATAWGKEAISAGVREQRELARLNRAKFSKAIEQSHDQAERACSENPDRGLTSA